MADSRANEQQIDLMSVLMDCLLCVVPHLMG
jgi:hypothetical protein